MVVRRRALFSALVVLGSLGAAGCSNAIITTSGAEGASTITEITTTEPSTTEPSSTGVQTTDAPTTEPPTTQPETTEAPVTEVPATEVATTEVATTEPPSTSEVPAPEAVALPANFIAVDPIDPPLQAVGGRSGAETARVQLRLFSLGFWLSVADGGYGLTTQQAVMAFQKYTGLDPSGKVDGATADALTTTTVRPVARANAGTLVEVDKLQQLLYFVVDGQTAWILNTSTGSGKEYTAPDKNTPGEMITGVSITPNGLHKVNRERPDGWWEGDLGTIYRPKYFAGGAAVHGSNSIPSYPASHGCVRVSVPAMDWIWASGIMPLRTPVWVHD